MVVIGDRLRLYKPSRPDYSQPEVFMEEVSLGRVVASLDRKRLGPSEWHLWIGMTKLLDHGHEN